MRDCTLKIPLTYYERDALPSRSYFISCSTEVRISFLDAPIPIGFVLCVIAAGLGFGWLFEFLNIPYGLRGPIIGVLFTAGSLL